MKNNKKQDLTGIHKFSIMAYVEDLKAGELDACAKVGQFVGYNLESKGYHIYWPNKHSVTVEHNVVFILYLFSYLFFLPLSAHPKQNSWARLIKGMKYKLTIAPCSTPGFAISAFLAIEIIFAFGILIRAGACTKLTIDLNYTATLATGPSVSLPITD
jgi:hypothetical protein